MMIFIKNKSKICFCIVVISICNLILTQSNAEQSIEELANSGLSKSQGMASSEESGRSIPNYSTSEVENESNNLENMDDAEMKAKAQQKMSSADSNSAEGITRDSMNKKTIEGYENQEIFTKGDKINEDPISAYERMTSEGCKEKENQQKPQYKKVTKKETVTDTEIYEQTCERPAGNIVCEKTLSVDCGSQGICGYDEVVIEPPRKWFHLRWWFRPDWADTGWYYSPGKVEKRPRYCCVSFVDKWEKRCWEQ